MDEMKSFQTKSRDFLRKQGFYIVLGVCVLIVGIAVALTAFPKEAEPQAAASTPEQVVQSSLSEDESLNARRTPLPTATPTPLPSQSPLATATPTPASQGAGRTAKKAAAPLDGAILWGYAADQLLYSKTLDQWTTHLGIDLAADQGAEVKAVLPGTVHEVKKDDALGYMVVIEHSNKRVSIYANLAQTVPVTQGQKVNAGDVIGTVGDTAVAECGEASHLHFGFLVDGKPADPMEHVLIPH